MKTYCPLLWEEMYINEKGDVYSCCHQFPHKLGNIKENTLAEIYNGDKLKRYRKKALKNQLLCAHICTLLSPKERSHIIYENIHSEYTVLKRLKVTVGTACNIRCVMCWQDHENPLVLSAELLKKQIDLKNIERIDIQGGEPLFIPEAREFYDYCAQNNVAISFLTNGMLMSDEWIEKVVKHSHMISFSLNAATRETHEAVNRGSKWEIVLQNIKKLRRRRDEENSPLRIVAHMTMINKNVHETAQFITLIDEIGVDEMNFGFDPRLRLFLYLHPKFRKNLRYKIQEIMKNIPENHRINTSRLKILKLI